MVNDDDDTPDRIVIDGIPYVRERWSIPLCPAAMLLVLGAVVIAAAVQWWTA